MFAPSLESLDGAIGAAYGPSVRKSRDGMMVVWLVLNVLNLFFTFPVLPLPACQNKEDRRMLLFC